MASSPVTVIKRWYHKPWVYFTLVLLLGVFVAASALGMTMHQTWLAFKGRYLNRGA